MPHSTLLRSIRAKIARWRVQGSLIVAVQLFLPEQLVPFSFSSPVANHALKELRRSARPATSAAAMSRLRGVRFRFMPLPKLSQGLPIPVSILECGSYLLLLPQTMATGDSEGLHPPVTMIRFPPGHCGRIACISLEVVHACSTYGLTGRKAAAIASRVEAVRAQGLGYRKVVRLRLPLRPHRPCPGSSRSALENSRTNFRGR
jgi:hypothetical protein